MTSILKQIVNVLSLLLYKRISLIRKKYRSFTFYFANNNFKGVSLVQTQTQLLLAKIRKKPLKHIVRPRMDIF